MFLVLLWELKSVLSPEMPVTAHQTESSRHLQDHVMARGKLNTLHKTKAYYISSFDIESVCIVPKVVSCSQSDSSVVGVRGLFCLIEIHRKEEEVSYCRFFRLFARICLSDRNLNRAPENTVMQQHYSSQCKSRPINLGTRC